MILYHGPSSTILMDKWKCKMHGITGFFSLFVLVVLDCLFFIHHTGCVDESDQLKL